jgi:hypothetical protein
MYDINFDHFPGEIEHGYKQLIGAAGDTEYITPTAPGADMIYIPLWWFVQVVPGAGTFTPNLLMYWEGAGAAEYEKHVAHKRKADLGPSSTIWGTIFENFWPKFLNKDMTFALNKRLVVSATGVMTNGWFYVNSAWLKTRWPLPYQSEQ